MPSVARTSNFPNDTTLRGIHEVIYHAWSQREPVGRSIFNVRESTQFREHTLTAGGVANMDEVTEGEAVNYESPVEGFLATYTHVKYGKGIRITEEQWGDDLYGIMEESPEELGRSAYSTEETLLANVFNNGFDATAATGPDGIELFATTHIRENTQTYRNEPSSAVDLSTTSMEAAVIDFANFRDGGGKRLGIQPSKLLVARDNQFNAARILQSTHRPEDDTNAMQPVGDVGLSWMAWDYLTDTDAWFLLAEKGDHKLYLWERFPFTTSHIFDFDTGDLKFKGVFRQSSSWGDPRGVYGSPGA